MPRISHSWNFLSNHAHVLCCIARDPECTMLNMANQVGITLRAVQKIVAELEHAGVISHQRKGRHNCYQIHAEKSLRHPLESHHTVADLMQAVML